MAYFSRIQTLKNKHFNLDKEIQDELKRPWPNNKVIHMLKREKLYVKEEIHKLSNYI